METKAVYKPVETLSVKDVAEILEFDPQTVRNQIAQDIENGTNESNFNAFKVGNRIKIPRDWFMKKAYGRNYEVPEKVANVLIKMGMAIEDE